MLVDVMGLDIERVNHDCFRVRGSGKTVYFDPYKVDREDEADVVFVSHEHYDHCNPEDIEKVSGANTTLVVNTNSVSKVSNLNVGDLKSVQPGQSFNVAGLSVETVAAYNTNKFRAPDQPFHPKEDGHVGYVVDFDGVKLYHTGDADVIEEMEGVDCDIALIPVSGTYVMTAEEAVEAVEKIKPDVAIPMHYGEVAGDETDAQTFRDKASCKVVIA